MPPPVGSRVGKSAMFPEKNPGKIPHLSQLLDLMEGYVPARILTTAAKLGLLDPVFQPATPEEIAARCHLPSKGIHYLLDALVAMDLFEKREGIYAFKGEIRELFKWDPDLRWDLIHHDHLYDVWGRLERGIRLGHSPDPPKEDLARYPESLEIFLRAMGTHARRMVPILLRDLSWESVHNLLDLGGGGAGFALSLVRGIGKLHVTLMDLPDAVALTETFLEKEPERDRIRCLAGNAYTDPLPAGPFDRILISHLLHIYPEEENRRLILKVSENLEPGKELLLIDYFLNEAETSPREAVFFRLLMLIGTPNGDGFSVPTVKEWLRDAGLEIGRVLPLDRGNTLILAHKP